MHKKEYSVTLVHRLSVNIHDMMHYGDPFRYQVLSVAWRIHVQGEFDVPLSHCAFIMSVLIGLNPCGKQLATAFHTCEAVINETKCALKIHLLLSFDF